MSVEDLPRGFYRPTRRELVEQFQKNYRIRMPGAPTGTGSEAFIDANVEADMQLPVYANASSMAAGNSLEDMTLAGLMAEARAIGIPELLPASGGAGFVKITAAVGGAFIEQDREIKDDQTGLRFRVLVGGTYVNDQPVPIIGVDVGPETNLLAGAVLRWTTQPVGLLATATVLEDTNGDGLTGGRFEESREELIERIKDARAQPAAAANIAEVRGIVKRAGSVLGIPVQEVFAYSCIAGPGTIAYCFTLRPARPGGSRSPNATQRTAVHNFVLNAEPEDDGLLPCTILESGVTVKLKISWAPGAQGWADTIPWPIITDDFQVTNAVAPTTTTFRVSSSAGGSATAPQVGQTVAFYDATNAVYVPKRIGAVASVSSGVWDITCDTTFNASDLLYVPSNTERFCPWSASLQQIVEPMLLAFGELGPGEQVASFFDAGYRQRRWPVSPLSWPSNLRHKMLDAVDDLEVINDVTWESPTLPYTTPVGTAGVSSNLTTLSRLLAFPL